MIHCFNICFRLDYHGDEYDSTSTTIASKVSCIHSVKFAAQLQRFYGPSGEHYQETKPVLLHLVGLNAELEQSNNTLSGENEPNANYSNAKTVATHHRVAVASMSIEEVCRIFAFIIHTIQAPWPLPPRLE